MIDDIWNRSKECLDKNIEALAEVFITAKMEKSKVLIMVNNYENVLNDCLNTGYSINCIPYRDKLVVINETFRSYEPGINYN